MRDFALDHESLGRLEPHFKELERQSLTVAECPSDKFLAFRLDGVRASRIHLKNHLSNEAFKKGMHGSIWTTYNLLRREVNSRDVPHANLFLCALSYSDEVTFVVSQQPNHFQHRSMKIGSTLAGVLSSAMTINLAPESVIHKSNGKTQIRKDVIAFDARPVILSGLDEILDYMQFRWLVASRNALGKVLRLGKVMSDSDLFETPLKANLYQLWCFVEKYHLLVNFAQALEGFTIYLPTRDGKLETLRNRDVEFDFDLVGPKLKACHSWLSGYEG